jgi:hypothetical protein
MRGISMKHLSEKKGPYYGSPFYLNTGPGQIALRGYGFGNVGLRESRMQDLP